MPVYRKYKKNRSSLAKRRKRALRCIAVGLILLLPFWLFECHVRPVVVTMAENNAKVYATDLINRTVQKQLCDNSYDYDRFIHIFYSDSGQINSIQANTLNINKMHTEITGAVNQALSNLDKTTLYISAGNLFRIPFFANRGPKIGLKVLPQGNVHTQIVSSLEDAGINQTIHRLTFHLSVNIASIIPTCSSQVQIDLDYPLAETIIVGSVPNFYAKVLSDKTQTAPQSFE